MKPARKYIYLDKLQNIKTNNNFNNVLSAQKTKVLHCNQILTIYISIPDTHAKYQKNGTFHKKHTFSEHGKIIIIIKKPENSDK